MLTVSGRWRAVVRVTRAKVGVEVLIVAAAATSGLL